MVIIQTIKNNGLVESYIVRHGGRTYQISKENAINLALQNRIDNCTLCNRNGSMYIRVNKPKSIIQKITTGQKTINIEKAKSFIRKQQILGVHILDINIKQNGDIELVRVHDSDKTEIVIPSWITKLVRNDDSSGPFTGTHYTNIRVEAELKDVSLMFSGIESDTLVIDMPKLSMAVDSTGMFYNCSNLKSITFKRFNTCNIRVMQEMFCKCTSLISLDLSCFDTSKVSSMDGMFYKCKSLNKINLRSFKTPELIDMSNMFDSCSLLQILDLSSFTFEKLRYMKEAFAECNLLQMIIFNRNNKSKHISNLDSVFSCCYHIKSLDLSWMETVECTSMYDTFAECRQLEQLDISNFDTSKVITMEQMFRGCKSLIKLDLSFFRTSNLENTAAMFADCLNLEKLDISNFDTSRVKNFNRMFFRCKKLVGLDISHFKISKQANRNFMLFSVEGFKLPQ